MSWRLIALDGRAGEKSDFIAARLSSANSPVSYLSRQWPTFAFLRFFRPSIPNKVFFASGHENLIAPILSLFAFGTTL